MSNEIQPEAQAGEPTYSIRRLKSVLGKAGAIFGDIREHFQPVYATLLGEVANEIVPEAAQALEDEIKAVEQHAAEMVDALKAKLISTINAHIQATTPAALAVLYPPVSTSLNVVPANSPIAAPAPAMAQPATASPSGEPLPDFNAGDNLPAATPIGDGGM